MSLKVKNNIASINSLRHLSQSQSSLSKSLERLASGQKINSAGDSPAGLIISENLRAQVAGIEQAINNSEFTISMVQTAEGALTEVNNLLIQARQLSLSAANEGGNDDSTLAALQEQLRNALESIDRVSAETRFGNKTLLDGSRGIAGVANGGGLEFVGATEKTKTAPVEGYDVEVTQFAERASISSALEDSQVENLRVSLTEGGRAITVDAKEGDTAESFASRLVDQAAAANLDLTISFNKDSGNLSIEHNKYGSDNEFVVSSSEAGVLAQEANIPQLINNGKDIEGKINGESATGKGELLTGNAGNANTDGLAVRYSQDNLPEGAALGVVGSVSVLQNSLTFQIGPNRGQTIQVAIEDTSSSALARGLPNVSGFQSLSDIDVTTAQGAQDSLLFLDEAIGKVSQVRGRLGAFQKNALESNVSTLRVAAENLVAAESTIRDTDVARELAEFTKNQILTQTAAATTAQASSLSGQAVRLIDRTLS